MPMERDRYPKDWSLTAIAIKDAAHWQCQQCARPCRKPSESVSVFEQRLDPKWKPLLAEKLADYERTGVLKYRPQRFLLTVAHLDQDPSNSAPENLKALCAPCHLRYDRRFQGSNRMKKLERRGQLNLFEQEHGGDPAQC
jgi:hypothetical protein